MSSLEIESSDIIRLIEQYLKENNLFKSLKALQDETSVSLNTVDSIESFVNDINQGHWDVVLKVVKLLKLPDNTLTDLYEQIAIELIENKERAAFRIINKTEPLMKLESIDSARFNRLQDLEKRPYFDPREAYGSTREKRRNIIAQALKKEVTVVQPQRLLTLIGEAMKWQKQEGLLPSSLSIDLFTGKAHMAHAEEETYPNALHRHCIKPLNDVEFEVYICCAQFSPDGHYLVVGYSTGLIEARNATTGRFANDLKYQAQKDYMVTPGADRPAALCLCFNSGGDLLAIGDASGEISVRKFETGELVQKFKAHLGAITCIMFHKDGREILSGGHDKLIKLHGMRSKGTILEFKGHQKFINSIAFSRDNNYIVSGSSDSTAIIWNVKTGVKLKEYKAKSKIHTILLMPKYRDKDIFAISTKLGDIEFIDIEGKVTATLMVGQDEQKEVAKSNFMSICSSPKGNWIYSIDSKHIYCYNYSKRTIQKKLVAHEEDNTDLIGLIHHPFLNILATFDIGGNLKLWKP